MKNLQSLLAPFLSALTAMAPFLGSQAHGPVERGLTVPQSDVEKAMGNASPADKSEAVRLWRVAADAVADAMIFTATKGKVKAD
jgi:hypothetical protein